jgi:hypothetical protein
MARIPTPVPQSLVDWLGRVLSGSLADLLWKGLVAIVLILAVYALANLGVFGAIVGSIIAFSLVEPRVRSILVDLWTRNFWVWRV